MRQSRQSKHRQSKKAERRKKLIEWSHAVRERDGWKCQICGNTQHTNAHHILPKEFFKEFQFEVDNGITLCASCHRFGKFSAHKNGIWFTEWIKANRPELYALAVRRLI